jgi:hypothetical protein
LDEYDRRFLAEVFVPAMQAPKGLSRLNALMRRWIERARVVETHTGCLYIAGAFEYDDLSGPLRDQIARGVMGWRTMLRRAVTQAVETDELVPDTDAEQLVVELYSLMLGMYHEARFVRDPRAADRTHATYSRLIATYQRAASRARPNS